jgi:antitoxin VapB
MAGSGTDQKGGPPSRRAKLFWNGRSQAVRLPKEFRFEGDAVEIRREGSAIILEPVKATAWPEDYWEWVAGAREDLELGDVEAVGVGLLDVGLDDE